MSTLPSLMTPRLQLRALQVLDAARIEQLAGEKEVARLTSGIPHPYPRGQAERWISRHAAAWLRGEVASWGICIRGSDELIGALSLHHDEPHQRAELSYWLGTDYWHQGYASEAAAAALAWAFGPAGYQKVTASVYAANVRSSRLLERLGFVREGLQRRQINKDGIWHDLERWGMLREEYQAVLAAGNRLLCEVTIDHEEEPMITGIAHLCLRVADLERSVRFYHEGLGMAKAFEFRREDGTWFGQYLYAGGRNFIEIFAAELSAPAKGQSFGHMCLEVDDINATVETLRKRGIEVSEVKMGSDHAWQAWLTDPDGNRIELHGYTPEAKQLASIR